MGNHISVYSDTNIFQTELQMVQEIVNGIMNEKNMFKNRDYNFLSQDVCQRHYMLAESELNRHLKVNLKGLGETLVLIPKDEESKIKKSEICQRISNHYMKILYILCLLKYVYNLEKQGDFSISGIVFRNVRIVNNDIMEINFCNIPHKDYSKQGEDVYKINFGQLEGLRFLTEYFLDKKEASSFLRVLRQVLGRRSKGVVKNALCEYMNINKDAEHAKQIEDMYLARFNEKLTCDANIEARPGSFPNLMMFIEKDNPVFSKDYCFEMHKLVIPLNNSDGKKVIAMYDRMRSNYQANIKSVEKLLQLLVMKGKDGLYELKDLDRVELDNVISKVKKTIQLYYVQSILDYQNLLDLCKKIPNVNVSKS